MNTRLICLAAAVLLALGLLRMPYGYYQFLKIAITLSACSCIYVYYNLKKETLVLVFVAIAILYNPILPIRFPREDWKVINIISVAAFIVAAVFSRSAIEKK